MLIRLMIDKFKFQVNIYVKVIEIQYRNISTKSWSSFIFFFLRKYSEQQQQQQKILLQNMIHVEDNFQL